LGGSSRFGSTGILHQPFNAPWMLSQCCFCCFSTIILSKNHLFNISWSSLNSEYSIPTPKTRQKYTCTHDPPLAGSHALFTAGWTKEEICLQLNLTTDQVKYALSHRLTPQKQRSRKKPFLGP